MSDKVQIFDTTLRDGEQSAGVLFTEDDKRLIAERLAALRVDVIEAGFPAASLAELRAVQRIAREVRDTSICALARAVPADIEAAAEALAGAAEPRIHVFVNASDTQVMHQLHKSRAEVVEIAAAAVKLARSRVASVEFSPMDATRADPEFLAQLVRTAIASGARVINIPDTVGYILPAQLGARIADLYVRVPELASVTLSFHGQDDLGLATANALQAVTSGARQVEVTINGIGERAGNTSLEEVVMALRVHGPALGVHSEARTEEIYALSRLVEEKSRMPIAPNKAIVGRNAFRHASGIHQDGVIKHRETYEVIDPAWVGHAEGTRIVLGKLSGRAGLSARARELGYQLANAEVAQLYALFQPVAESQAEVSDRDVARLCDQVVAAR
jgi:2-isopropylmalate synthase